MGEGVPGGCGVQRSGSAFAKGEAGDTRDQIKGLSLRLTRTGPPAGGKLNVVVVEYLKCSRTGRYALRRRPRRSSGVPETVNQTLMS